jgi:hypothetical protein
MRPCGQKECQRELAGLHREDRARARETIVGRYDDVRAYAECSQQLQSLFRIHVVCTAATASFLRFGAGSLEGVECCPCACDFLGGSISVARYEWGETYVWP